MSVVERQESVTAWPDVAGELPFSLQRYRGDAVPPAVGDRLLRGYGPALARGLALNDEAVALNGGELVSTPLYSDVLRVLEGLGPAELRARATRRDRMLTADGVTFGGPEDRPRRPFPIDLMPRLLPAAEWGRLDRALVQRTRALTAFLADVHGASRIVRAGVVPGAVVERARGATTTAGTGSPVAPDEPRAVVLGIDLLRDRSGRWLVLEDNLRIPAGLGYAMQARRMMATVVPELTPGSNRRAVSTAAAVLRAALAAAAPRHSGAEPAVAVLSPGPSDSSWFEHRMLASAMKVPLVMPRDLVAVGDRVAILRPDGPRRLDVLYRRQHEQALTGAVSATGEPLAPMLLRAAGAGSLRLANDVGNGVADDKAVYGYVPAMIRYYLGEEPLLDNVPTRVLADPESCREVLSDLGSWVVKRVDALPAQDVVVGPHASAGGLERLRAQILDDPSAFVAQELVDFTSHPTLIGSALEPRHVDLRVFTVSTPEPAVLPNPLTRVALTAGSMIVNSFRGSGAKDTWIVD
jgi:carboxylate-amine ligase